MPRRRRGKSEAQPAATVIDAALASLGVDPAWRAVTAWSEVAGPTISARTSAERVMGGVLLVRVPSASWAHELSFFRGQLLERLRERTRVALQDVRFVVGPGPAQPVTEPALASVPAEPALPAATVAAVEAATAQLGDPELRAALRALGLRLVRD